jgi:3-oxoacyl-[acyl-carrier protein] reductase
MDVRGKVAIITGSSSGVGAALALQLASKGVRVVINYSRSQHGAERVLEAVLANGGEGIVVQADVGHESACLHLVEQAEAHFGGVDILVNNAGTTTFVPHAQLDLLTDDIWTKTLQTNLMGSFYMSRAVVASMRARGGGEIVMTSSIAGLTTHGSSIAYCASKAAVNSLTRTLAKALGADGIRVNAVCPGLIDGEWAKASWGGGSDEQWAKLKDVARTQTPLSHVVTPEDVADGIRSIIEGSDFVTGQLVTIDSGFTL